MKRDYSLLSLKHDGSLRVPWLPLLPVANDNRAPLSLLIGLIIADLRAALISIRGPL